VIVVGVSARMNVNMRDKSAIGDKNTNVNAHVEVACVVILAVQHATID
jgi:hypothetical protein